MLKGQHLLRSCSSCLSTALLFAFVTSGDTYAKDRKDPLVLESFRSFFHGGQRVAKGNDFILDGQLYVQALIPPRKSSKKPPIIMTHTTISSTIFLERANGEEGVAQIFARAGYPVYVVDPPGTGRAPRDMGLVTNLSQISQGTSSNWAGWKNGPAFGQLGFNAPDYPDTTPHKKPMNQMPCDRDDSPLAIDCKKLDPVGVNQFLGHSAVLRQNLPGSDSVVDPVRDAAYISLLEKIGEPVIWMGWSRGGLFGQRLIAKRPDLFAAFASWEGCQISLPQGAYDYTSAGYPPAEFDAFLQAMISHKIPFLHVNPDYGRDVSGVNAVGLYLPSGSRCVTPFDVAKYLRNAGVTAKTIYAPNVGVYGNGHNMFLQNNAEEFSEIYLDWFEKNVDGRKHR